MNHSLELQILVISDLFNAISVKSIASVRSCVPHVPVLCLPMPKAWKANVLPD